MDYIHIARAADTSHWAWAEACVHCGNAVAQHELGAMEEVDRKESTGRVPCMVLGSGTKVAGAQVYDAVEGIGDGNFPG